MKSPNKIYSFHVANLRAIDDAINQVARSLRWAISRADRKVISSFTRLYALLLGGWAECRLRKLTYEPNGYEEQERKFIESKNNHLERWMTAIEIAFRKHYNVPKSALSKDTLPHSAYSRYDTIMELLDNDLRPVIELRNKLAHGQWAFPLNSEGNDIAQSQMEALRIENLLSLQFKRTLISNIADTIHDLVISRPTFERDFDNHFRKIVDTRRNLKTREYESWANQMREKYRRGKRFRARASRNSQ